MECTVMLLIIVRKNHLQCAMVSETGKKSKPLLKRIPVERVFQIVGVDIMELPKINKGNQYIQLYFRVSCQNDRFSSLSKIKRQ